VSLTERLPARTTRSRNAVRPFEQLALELGPERPRWTFSRLVVRSPHQRRIVERLEFVRRFFPELEAATVHVGLAQKRGVLGWGSMDPERPGIWVRPRRLAYFTIAHEMTHLLQARGLVPQGERSCDLWALARSPLVIDGWPGYLEMPRALRARREVDFDAATFLHRAAIAAIAGRASGRRRYLTDFERAVADAYGSGPSPRARGNAR